MKKRFEKLMCLRFWLPVSIVLVLTYGFYLSNVSIGIDDPAGVFYFDWKVWLSQGRFGDEITSWFVDLSSYLPGWQNWIMLIILILSGIMWIVYFDGELNGTISVTGASIFLCIYLTFPYLTDILVIDNVAIFSSLSAFCAALAAIGLQEFQKMKKKLFFGVGIISLAIGLGCFETSAFYFIVGVVAGVFLHAILECRQYDKSYIKIIVNKVWTSGVLLITSFVLNRIILVLYLNKYKIETVR